MEMLEIGRVYSKPELTQMLGTRSKQGIDRKLQRYSGLPRGQGRPYERGFLTDGGCIQPVGIGDDTNPCAVWDGECQGQGQANRQTANNRRQHSRNFPPPLSRFQKRAVECFRIGKGMRFE